MLDALRRLTASYTEEEYQAWLNESITHEEPKTTGRKRRTFDADPHEYAKWYLKDAPEYPGWQFNYFELLQADGTYRYADKRIFKPVDWDKVSKKASIKGNEHIKDIACELACVADDTGYQAELLYTMFEECVQQFQGDGDTYETARKRAFETVVITSYERDW